ncbi:hypothetical protein B0J14DRAFT_590587 [Halenospora varia]|nr:hypothetical protein B0J14DRAFT_590587 [Halenospora varia]
MLRTLSHRLTTILKLVLARILFLHAVGNDRGAESSRYPRGVHHCSTSPSNRHKLSVGCPRQESGHIIVQLLVLSKDTYRMLEAI